jgi:hypothetical protein
MEELSCCWYLASVCGQFHNPAVLIPKNGRLGRPIWTYTRICAVLKIINIIPLYVTVTCFFIEC